MISTLNTNGSGSPIDFQSMARNPAVSEKAKVEEAARQFEAVLLRQILEQSVKTTIPSKLMPKSLANDIYRDMVTNQMADTICHSGAIGLGRTLAGELNHDRKVSGETKEGSAL